MFVFFSCGCYGLRLACSCQLHGHAFTLLGQVQVIEQLILLIYVQYMMQQEVRSFQCVLRQGAEGLSLDSLFAASQSLEYAGCVPVRDHLQNGQQCTDQNGQQCTNSNGQQCKDVNGQQCKDVNGQQCKDVNFRVMLPRAKFHLIEFSDSLCLHWAISTMRLLVCTVSSKFLL